MDLMGIWGYEGYVGLRITCRGMRDCGDMRDMRDMRGYEGYAGRTTSSKSPRPGCRFWGRPPQSKKGGKWERKTTSDPKKECLFLI